MFRLKFLTVAIVAAVALLAAPATSQAGFSVTVTIDGKASVLDLADNTDPFSDLSNAGWLSYDLGTDTWVLAGNQSMNQTGTGNIYVQYSAGTNLPGSGSEAYVFDTTGRVNNQSGVQHTVVIRTTAEPFTSPGEAGDTLYYNTTATILNGTLKPNDGNLDIHTEINGSGSDLDNYVLVDGVWTSPMGSFVRGSSFQLDNVIGFTLGAGEKSQVTSQSTVVAPAPAGLVLALTAVPFLAVLRRRMRQTVTA